MMAAVAVLALVLWLLGMLDAYIIIGMGREKFRGFGRRTQTPTGSAICALFVVLWPVWALLTIHAAVTGRPITIEDDDDGR